MAIKELLNKIISQVTGDNADALKQIARDAMVEADALTEAKLQVDNESKSRKEKIRTLESELATAKEGLEKSAATESELTRLKAIETEYKTHKQSIITAQKADWQAKQAKLVVDRTDKNYDRFQKLLPKFKLIEDGKELTEAELQSNLSQYELLNDAGFFGDTQTETQSPPARPGTPGTPQTYSTSGEALSKTMTKQPL